MKKSIFGKIGAAAVVLTLVTSSLVGGTFAKYVTEVNATATGTVANWNVTFSDTADGVYTNDTVFKLEGTGKEKKVIPGETGTFDIVINGDSADVDFDYTITFEKGTDRSFESASAIRTFVCSPIQPLCIHYRETEKYALDFTCCIFKQPASKAGASISTACAKTASSSPR